MKGKLCPDSSVIWVVAWKTSISVPSVSVKRIGKPEPVMKPGRLAIHEPGQ